MNKCILLIDDDEISNYLTEITIKEHGLALKVETALNGEEGLDKLKALIKDRNEEIPILILLDIKMPVMDGFGFLEKFNELDLENKPTVVILTSSLNPKDMLLAKEFDIKGYLNKPLSADELRNLLID
jgi:CheY-like chemotaxis protein